jgi:hypothetical protein
MFVESGA